MDLTKKLISLLRQYIEEFKKLKEEYKQKRMILSLYEELIQALKEHKNEENKLFIPILLDTIYGNNIYVDEYYRILLQPNKEELIQQFIFKLTKEYDELTEETKQLKERINRNENMFTSAHRVIAGLKYKTQITKSKNDIENAKRIISYYEMSGVISNREELLLINELELHNRKVASVKGSIQEKDYADVLYSEIPNILTIGFQEHDVIEISPDRQASLDKFAQEIHGIIPHIEIEEIIPTIENYRKYNLDDNEYNYIIVKILDAYLDDLTTLYEYLIDKEIYSHRSDRIDVIKNYYQILEKYIIILNYYNKINEYSPEIDEEEEEQVEEVSQGEKRLIYSHTNNNITKTRLISDMDDVPYEYYDTVYDLLTRFKNGKLVHKEYRTLTNHKDFNGHSELRYDQVRIILKHVKDNIYIVLGVFAKKTDNDRAMYRRIIGRSSPDVSTDEKIAMHLELAEHTEEELKTLVEQKGRKGTR